MTNNKPNTLTISDPLRAAVLMAQGIRLIDAIASHRTPTQMVYIFDDTDGAARLASGAIASNLSLPIGTFLECHRKAKELLHLFRIARSGEDRR